jgi:integrase
MATEKLSYLKVTKATDPGLYNDGGGLYLRVASGGSRQWIFRYTINGKTHDMGLGSADTFSLKEARERAREARKLKHDGIDPLEQRREKRRQTRSEAAKAITFRQCAEAYIAAHKAGWSNMKHAAQWPSTMARFVYPVFGELAVQAVDTGLVLRVIEPIWIVRTETASRVRGRIEAILDWATAHGHRQGENPARWRGHLANLLPRKSKVARVEHHHAMPYAQIGTFMSEVRAERGVAARALEFLILTATRTNETLGATWKEIDFAERVWSIPAERMKAGKPHRVALSDAAFGVIEAMRQNQARRFYFPRDERRYASQQHESPHVGAEDGIRRAYRARISQLFCRLGRRAHGLPG